MFGGPKIMAKMVPVVNLNADFLGKVVNNVESVVNQAGGSVLAILSDDNRTNQSYFSKFDTVDGKPWLTKDALG